MTFLEFLDRMDARRVRGLAQSRRQGIERQMFTLGLFAFAVLLVMMARDTPALWDVKLFEVILQAVVITGILNMAAAFQFAANKTNEHATENTKDAFRAITAAAKAGTADSGLTPEEAASDVADEARAKADEIAGGADAGLPDALK